MPRKQLPENLLGFSFLSHPTVFVSKQYKSNLKAYYTYKFNVLGFIKKLTIVCIGVYIQKGRFTVTHFSCDLV